MIRMTIKNSPYSCNIFQKCTANDWMYKLFNKYTNVDNICYYCPFKKYINHLAKLENELENFEDDGR